MEGPCPLVIDPTGRDIQGEATRIRERGPVTLVELPDASRRGPSVPPNCSSACSAIPGSPRTRAGTGRGGSTARYPPVASVHLGRRAEHVHRVRRRAQAAAWPGGQGVHARRTAMLRPRVEEITKVLLDSVEEAGRRGRAVDLREQFCYPLPIQVISELLGLPEEQRAELRAVVDGTFHTSASPEQVTDIYARFYAALGELVTLKRRSPGDDLTSALIAARDDEDGTRLSEQELLDTLMLIISAGHETTVNLIDNAIHLLLAHPAQLAHVRAGRASWDDAIEEALRVEAPVASLPLRYAVQDVTMSELGGPDGVVIRKGEAILALTPPSAATRTSTVRTPPPSTSPAATRSISPSATACTSAWARRWGGWRPASRCPLSSTASRGSGSPSKAVNWSRSTPSSPTATALCRSTCPDRPPTATPPVAVAGPEPPASDALAQQAHDTAVSAERREQRVGTPQACRRRTPTRGA